MLERARPCSKPVVGEEGLPPVDGMDGVGGMGGCCAHRGVPRRQRGSLSGPLEADRTASRTL